MIIPKRNTMKKIQRMIQYLIIFIVNVITLYVCAATMKGIHIQSIPAAIGVSLAFIGAQILYWWFFINFFSYLPVWLYPVLTVVLSGMAFLILSNLIPGVLIANLDASLAVTFLLTAVNAILASMLSINIEPIFDNNVTLKLIRRRGKTIKTDTPGFIYLQIDGLSQQTLRRAMERGSMPFLKTLMDTNSHHLAGWQTDFTSQTCAMQAGILYGNNEDIPAYRWWERDSQRVFQSGKPQDSLNLEKRLSNGKGLLANGGSSRGNMFSGDAAESLFTFSTLLNGSHGRGPGFYLYLINPFITIRLISIYVLGVVKEWWQSLRQRMRRDRYICNARNFLYGFYRAAVGPLLQELTTTIVISDLLRGLPAIFALYSAYDDIGHFAGMETPEAFEVLMSIDRSIARIQRAFQYAPRPYHLILLSDHGQSNGPSFKAKYGITLDQLVKGSVQPDSQVYASLNTNEAWESINALLNEAVNADTRTAHVLREMVKSRMTEGTLAIKAEHSVQKQSGTGKDPQLIVLASGCTGLIYTTGTDHRMSYEELLESYPDLILNLTQHPGIGFVLVHSAEQGDMVLGKEGINFLDQGVVEGVDPLDVYPFPAVPLLKRESRFRNCPDLLINTTFDPDTQELCGFENQVSHHGGLGGPQNDPFLFYPGELPLNASPLVGATEIYTLLKKWQAEAWHIPPEIGYLPNQSEISTHGADSVQAVYLPEKGEVTVRASS